MCVSFGRNLRLKSNRSNDDTRHNKRVEPRFLSWLEIRVGIPWLWLPTAAKLEQDAPVTS